MIVRVPLGTSVELRNNLAGAGHLPPEQETMTVADWSTLANVLDAYLTSGRGDVTTTVAMLTLKEKCRARMFALSGGEVLL